MKLLNVKQGSMEWLEARAGIPTASEADALISPTWKIRTGQGVETYVAKKLAEHWIQGPLPAWHGNEAEIGQVLEERAKPWYELTYGITLQEVGFITTDDGFAGCSPDAMVNDNCGLEIKCPAMHTHVGYLLDGILPTEYEVQVHFSMFVTGVKNWQFMSYNSQLPKLVLPIKRDDDKCKIIATALELFREKFNSGLKLLEELNGGPRPVIPKLADLQAQYGEEQYDLMP